MPPIDRDEYEYEPIPCPSCGHPTKERRRVLRFSVEETRRWNEVIKKLDQKFNFYFWGFMGGLVSVWLIMQLQLPAIFPFLGPSFILRNPFYPSSAETGKLITETVLGSSGEWHIIVASIVQGVCFSTMWTIWGILRFKVFEKEKRGMLSKHSCDEKEEYVVR